MRAKQKFHTIRVKDWNVNLDIDKMSNKKSLANFSSFKKYMKTKHPNIIEKHRLKSRLITSQDNIKIEKIIAWDSVLEDAINKNIINKFLKHDRS